MEKNSVFSPVYGQVRGLLAVLLPGMVLAMLMNNAACASSRSLPDCPSSPNCVSSQAGDKKHYVEPLSFRTEPGVAWQALILGVKSLPRSKIVVQSEDYLHAEFSSRVFHFVDDVEFILDPGKKVIQVRSASRIGYGDFGVNRRRVESIREQFLQQLRRTSGR